MQINYIKNQPKAENMVTNLNMVEIPAGFGCYAFYLAEMPITEEQWVSMMGGEIKKGKNYPKVNVSFLEASEFCKKLSEYSGVGFRLPTEHEFCRALGVEPSNLEDFAVFNQPKIVEVKTKLPNEYGLYDMRGLVWEWLDTKYDNDRYILRGGSWYDFQLYARAVYRNNNHPAIRYDFVGFRVVGGVRPPSL